jgi:hypothetical protein
MNFNSFGLGRINELLISFYLNKEEWPDRQTKQQFDQNRRGVNPEQFKQQDGRARVMASEFLKSARLYGWRNVKKVIWTAVNTTALQRAVDPQNKLNVNSKTNPSDIVVQFMSAPLGASKFLGLSAKSYKGLKAGISFKNPGITTIDSDLGIDLEGIYKKELVGFIKKYHLNPIESRRKVEIRLSRGLDKAVNEVAADVIIKIRDALMKKFKSMTNDRLKYHFLGRWLDAEEIFPPYLKVIGEGVKEPFLAKVEDPRNNDKLENINTGKITLTAGGSNTIIVYAGRIKVFTIRAKFKDQKMASSIKFSAEPVT